MPTQLDSPAPDFSLPDLTGQIHHLKDSLGKIVIINFWSCECPHAERTDAVIVDSLSRWGDKVELLSIASNKNEPLEELAQAAARRDINQVLRDADCAVANLYDAVTTPHVFVLDRGGVLRYRGAVDDVTFRQRVPSQNYLYLAVEALLDGSQPQLQEISPYGCAIVREV